MVFADQQDLSNQLSLTLAAMSVDEAGRHRAHVMRTAVAFIAAWDGRLRIVRAADSKSIPRLHSLLPECNACEKAGKPCVVAAIVLQGGGSRAVSSQVLFCSCQLRLPQLRALSLPAWSFLRHPARSCPRQTSSGHRSRKCLAGTGLDSAGSTERAVVY